MSLSRRTLWLSALLAVAALSANAKPNLSGDWKLNATKSDFGEMPPPSSMVQKIAHEDPKLKLSVKQSSDRGDFAWDAAYTTDGSESSNSIGDNASKSIVKWDGDVLTFDTKAKFGDNDFTLNDRWTLSEDGKTITIQRKVAGGFGEMAQKLVFEKQ